jgi:23S rRNA (cytosine1962-C5)-methyltransferase
MSQIWHLKKGSEKKFRMGHPWVFSNELAQSPKGIRAGELIQLREYNGGFLAWGYGHPNSLISFRTLSLRENAQIDVSFFVDQLRLAARTRLIAGVDQQSHRLCFAEGDWLPGLIIDRFVLGDQGSSGRGHPRQVFVVQSSTAGMELNLDNVVAALEVLANEENQAAPTTKASWANTGVIFANDSKSRLLEGLTADPKKVIKPLADFNPEKAVLKVQPGLSELPDLEMYADLIGGQKTGFFLDQRLNVQMTSRFVSQLKAKKELRVLDLCCYIGQWGTQMAHLASSLGMSAHVTLVDASAHALEIAAANVEKHGGVAETKKLDVLGGGLDQLEAGRFDVVICDPPAFIKKKKDLPTGAQAYYKMNREAIRKTARQGLYVSCSCSGLFTEEDFRSMLTRVGPTYSGAIRWLARGSHSPDHPQRPEFPQGTYLKSWIGAVL